MRTWRLLGPAGFYDSPYPGLMGGHRRERIYGRLECPSAARWLALGHYSRHRVFFRDELEALACGFRPCSRCLPEAYASWKVTQAQR